MPKYTVRCIRPVSDLLQAVVTVEADNEEEAKEKALAEASDKDLYTFWQCDNDDDRETTAEIVNYGDA